MTKRVETAAKRIDPDYKTKQPTTQHPTASHGFNLREPLAVRWVLL